MKPIPGYPGHPWEVTQRSPEGLALKLRFARTRGQVLDGQLRKHPRVGGDGAAPWYLRGYGANAGWQRVSPLQGPAPSSPEGIVAALRNALDHLAATATRDPFQARRERQAYRAQLTLARLAADWLALGMPDARKGALKPRTASAQADLRPNLEMALRWWGERDPATVSPRMMRDYHAHRCAAVAAGPRAGSGTGSRCVDLELGALRSLCDWAVLDERVNANPFATRPTFRDSEDITHCCDKAPATDEELHRLADWLLAREHTVVSGARLLFGALTGLRPGEHGLLRWDARELSPRRYEPGHRFRDATGRELLVVQRLKHGMNPAVEVHPALADFLATWRDYHLTRWPGGSTPWLFPRPDGEGGCVSGRLSRDLQEACAALGLPPRTGHGARAFFVAVQRSHGTSDPATAVLLGQTSGGPVVSRVYGHRADIHTTGHLDWLPEGRPPAWSVLRPAPGEATLVTAAFGR